MRFVWIALFELVALAATAQVTVSNSDGTAVPGAWGAGVDAGVVAYVPVSPNPVGATNATGQNVAGATDSTINHVPGLSFASADAPVYFWPEVLAARSQQFDGPANGEFAGEMPGAQARYFRFGAVRADSAYSAALLPGAPNLAEIARMERERMASARNVRTYTNADIARVHQDAAGGKPMPVSNATIRPYEPGGGAAQARFDRNVGFRARTPITPAPAPQPAEQQRLKKTTPAPPRHP